MQEVFRKARTFMYRHARPLDMARWQYHFEDGEKENVLQALSYYQNADGGFAYALEADAWNPNSSPIQTWTATEILREMDFTDSSHPIIQGILRYLASGADFDGTLWYNELVSTNDYPHAPWWHAETDSADSYNPTACLAGFILRFADRDSDLFALGSRIAQEACAAAAPRGLSNDMHAVILYIRLMEYCTEAGITDVIDLAKLRERLQEQVKSSITHNTAEWETGYISKPSHFFMTPDSEFYTPNRDIAAYECDFIANTQLPDGSWMVPWGWRDYPEEWALSKSWWKANGAIINMRYLKGMGRL